MLSGLRRLGLPITLGVEIDVSEALSEAGVEDEVKRKLVCPETLLPIRAELLLIRAGLSVPSSASLPKDGPIPLAWWNFHPSSLQGGGDGKGSTKKGTLLVSVFDKASSPSSSSSGANPVKNQELYSKFMRLFGEMNGDISVCGISEVILTTSTITSLFHQGRYSW